MYRLKRLLGLSQETYIKKMLKHYDMHDCKPMDSHIKRNLSLSLDICPKKSKEKEQMSKVPYSSVVKSLIYGMMCTRPNIFYVVGLARKFQYNPSIKHWMTVKRILRYLKGTIDYVFFYKEKDL